jgi:hypothetical protein
MAISRLLARLGFVRIGTYGLMLTPDDRILSTRPAVLDDGLGGKIVGWNDGDLAAMELEHWSPLGGAKPAPAKLVALPPPPPKKASVAFATTVVATPAQFVAPPIPQPVISPVAAPIPVAPVQVAPSAPTEDDEWEWEIAVAKARAAADPIPADNWPKTQELREEVKRWEPEPAPRHLVLPHQRTAQVAAKPPARMPKATSQPVPRPELKPYVPIKPRGDLENTKVRPVVTLRTPSSPRIEPPKTEKIADKATRQVAVAPTRPVPVEAPKATVQAPLPKQPRASSKHEETIRTLSVPPANDDKTDTAIALPPAPVIASTARRLAAARQR